MKKAIIYTVVLSVFTLFSQRTIAQTPVITGLSLDASSPANSSNDDLIASYTNGPGVVETALAWYCNSRTFNILYFPFEGGASNALLDFSGNNNHLSTSGDSETTPVWDVTGGINGSGAYRRATFKLRKRIFGFTGFEK